MRRVLVYGGVAVLAVLLIGAAFVGGQLLSGGEVGRFVLPFLRRGGTTGVYSGELIRAEELPEEAPIDTGEVVSVTGKRITIRPPRAQMVDLGEGRGAGVVTIGGESESKETEDDGERVEVLVTRNTKIWKTQPSISPGMVPEGPIKQEVEEATLDDIKPGDYITVWGTKSGDRVNAEVILLMSLSGVVEPPERAP